MEENFTSPEQHFAEWLESKGLKPETVRDYLFYYNKISFEDLEDRDYISKFLNDYKNNPVARAFLKNLFNYKGIKFELPQVTGRRKSRIPKVITEEEVLKIAEAMENERNKIMVLITFYCGLRRGELLKMKPKDFNWNQCKEYPGLSQEELGRRFGRLRTIGKGDKEGIAFVPGNLMVRIGRFLKHDLKISQGDMEERMFKIGEKRWTVILEKASLKAIGRKVNPHLLRHSYGTYLLRKGMGIRHIQKALRHSSISSTQIYTHVDDEDLEQEFLNKLGN